MGPSSTPSTTLYQAYWAICLSSRNTHGIFVSTPNIPSEKSRRRQKKKTSIFGRDLTAQKNSFWMCDSKIQSKLMKDLKIPGTHDSATYALTTDLSPIKYADISSAGEYQLGPKLGAYTSSTA